jgi:thioredoxin reductase (NADPH)
LILQAIALGHIDAYANRPARVPDEKFHLAVTELLEDRARSNLPRPEVMRIVGEERSARSHEIRDLLSRNVVPFGFYPAGERSVTIRLIHDYLRGQRNRSDVL